KGDVVTFSGEEPLTRTEFYEIADELTKRGVDIRFETLGITFNNPDNIRHIFKKYRVREVLIKLYSLNFPENDRFFSYFGTSMKTMMGLMSLKETGFKNISILTYILLPDFIRRIKDIYKFKQENGLKYLYIELDKRIPFDFRVSICREILDKIGEKDDIIIRNNNFEIRAADTENTNIDIRTDTKNGILNLVLRNFCSNNCTFCTTRIVQRAYNSPLPYDSKEKVLKAIRDNVRNLKEKNLFEIVAVEPLEHPYILEILKKVKEYGFKKIKLLTHGRPLRDPSLLNQLKERGVKEIIIPLSFYSPGSALRTVDDDRAYYDFLGACENILKEKSISFICNIMIFRQNYRDIDKIVDFLRKTGIADFNFNIALPSIDDKRFFASYGVRFTDLLDAVKEIQDRDIREKIALSLSYIIPPCIIVKYYGNNIIQKISEEHIRISEKSLSSKREYSRHKSTIRCIHSEVCRFSDFCCGVNKVYSETFGYTEFKAVR
ncbi:MAG: radical SAM protein, partial [Deltaproteobacteria bacterium]|nr:radical SAM protein [Deltaproteobacteria bacterium]